MLKSLKRLTIGLTGGIGAGKSSALELFARSGAKTLSLDALAHELSAKGRPVHRSIVRAFGRSILNSQGEIDRRALGKKVFSSRPLLKKLERATHPLIRKEMRRRVSGSSRRVVVVDVPLLFEGGLHKDFDVTVLVSAKRETRISRVKRRDGLSRAEVLRRICAQMPERKKRAAADVVIDNDGTIARLGRSVREYQDAFELIAGGRQ
jgi:dephospho-CoA kinase